MCVCFVRLSNVCLYIYVYLHFIDTNHSMLLSRLEFKAFLSQLHITFSNKRWKQIFRAIDRNMDDEISFDELFLFIFPTQDEAIIKEKKRLQSVRHRVHDHDQNEFFQFYDTHRSILVFYDLPLFHAVSSTRLYFEH